MDIDLHNIECAPELSNGSYAFVADLVINRQTIAKAYNDGEGGPTVIDVCDDNAYWIEIAAEYLRGLPEIDFVSHKERPELGNVISQLLVAHEARQHVHAQLEAACGAGQLLVYLRDCEQLRGYDMGPDDEVQYGGETMAAREAVLRTQRDHGHDPIVINDVLARDPGQAALYAAQSGDREAYRLMTWTLRAAVEQASQDSQSSDRQASGWR